MSKSKNSTTASSETVPASPKSLILCLSLLAAAAVLAYSNSFNASFHFDDTVYVINNPDLYLEQLTPFTLLDAARKTDVPRPWAMMGFAAQVYLAGNNVLSYHLVNFLIHLACVFFVFFLIMALLRHSRPPTSLFIALVSAAWWALLPMHTAAVTYIWQRITAAAALGFAAACWAYLRARKNETSALNPRPYYLAAALAAVFAFGNKEISATLPFALIVLDFLFFPMEIKKNPKRIFFFLTAFIALALYYSLWHKQGLEAAHQFLVYENAPNRLQQLLTSARIWGHYLTLLAWPHPSRLALDFAHPLSQGLLAPPTTLLSIIFLALIAGLAWRLKKHEPIISFGIAWFFLGGVIEALSPAAVLAYEYRMYLPSIGVAIVLAGLLSVIARRRETEPRQSHKVMLAIFAFWVSILGFWTFQRNKAWATELTLWKDNALKTPHNPRAHANYALNLAQAGRTEEALPEYEKALALQPHYALLYRNYGVALFTLGRTEEAIEKYLKAKKLDPSDGAVFYDLGYAYFTQGKLELAEKTYLEGLQSTRPHWGIYLNLGNVYLSAKRLKEANQSYSQGLQMFPQDARLYSRRGDTLYLYGSYLEALTDYRTAAELNPSYPGLVSKISTLEKFLKLRLSNPKTLPPPIVDLP